MNPTEHSSEPAEQSDLTKDEYLLLLDYVRQARFYSPDARDEDEDDLNEVLTKLAPDTEDLYPEAPEDGDLL